MIDRMTAFEVFHAVVEGQSLASAADKLGMSRPTVTRHIQQLETWLNARLIVRTTRSLVVTEAGKRLLEESREILQKLDTIEAQMSLGESDITGELKVSLPLGMTKFFIKRLPEFTQQYPKLLIRLDLSDQYVDLINDSYDIAIRAGDLQSSGLYVRKLRQCKDVLVASPVYLAANPLPKIPEDLKKHQCILDTNHPQYNKWIFVRSDKVTTIPITGQIILSHTDAIIEAAINGFGIAHIPDFAAQEAIKEGTLIRILEDHQEQQYPLSALFPEREYTPKKIRVFIDFLVGIFNES